MTLLESGRLAIKRLSSNSLTRMLRWTPQYIRRTPSRTRRPLTYGDARIKKKGEETQRERKKQGKEKVRKEGIERERKNREKRKQENRE